MWSHVPLKNKMLLYHLNFHIFFIELQKFNKKEKTLTNPSRTTFFLNFNFLIFQKWQFLAEILSFTLLL
jgi:hypothetical protein